MSLLRSEGHPNAGSYPLCVLWHEVEIVQERHNQRLATEALLTQAAVAALLSKEAGKTFRDTIKRLTDGD